MTAEKQNKIIPGVTVNDEISSLLINQPSMLNLLIESDYIAFSVQTIPDNLVFHIQTFDISSLKTRAEKETGIEKLLMENEWLKKNYASVHVGISNHLLTIVPDKFYDAAQSDLFINFNIEVPEKSSVRTDELNILSSKLIYACSQKIEDSLRLYYQNCKINHATTLLLQSLAVAAENDSLIVYVEPHRVQFIIFSEGKLKFYNCFLYQAAADYAYFLLNVCKQLNLDSEKIKVVLYGEVVKNSDIFNITYKYIRNVSFGGRPNGKNYSAAFDFPAHFYFNLFSL